MQEKVKRIFSVIVVFLCLFTFLSVVCFASSYSYTIADYKLPCLTANDETLALTLVSGTSTRPYALYVSSSSSYSLLYRSIHVITNVETNEVTCRYNLAISDAVVGEDVVIYILYASPTPLDFTSSVTASSIVYKTASELTGAYKAYYVRNIGSSVYVVNESSLSDFPSVTACVVTISAPATSFNVTLETILPDTTTQYTDYIENQTDFMDTVYLVTGNRGFWAVLEYLVLFWEYAWIVDFVGVTVVMCVIGIFGNWIATL